jgi:PAS domain S-box-containing protein
VAVKPQPEIGAGPLVALSGEGLARFDLDAPIDLALSEDEQYQQLLRTARVADCNDAWAALHGRSAGRDLVGLYLREFGGELPERLRVLVERRFEAFRVETGFRRHDGVFRWSLTSIVPAVESNRLTRIWVASQDITAKKQVEEELERRARILEAVAESAARLMTGSWHDQVPGVLRLLGEAIAASRSHLLEIHDADPDGTRRFSTRFEWTADGVPPLQGLRQQVSAESTGLAERLDSLQRNEPILASVAGLPPRARAYFQGLGVGSVASVPVFVSGRLWGALSFHSAGDAHPWTDPELDALRTAATCLAAAMERQRSDEALRESEERFALLARASHEGIAITVGGIFADLNERLADMLGSTVEGLRGRSVLDFVARDHHERVRRHIASGSTEPYTHLARRTDGSMFPVEIRAASIPFRGGTARVTSLRDVTALRESEERYRLLFEGNPLPMLVYDLDSLRFLAANEAAVAQYGWSRAELLRLTLGDLALPGDPDYAAFIGSRHEDRPPVVHVGARQQRRRDGRVLDIDLVSIAISFDGRDARLMLAPDVGEQRRAEEERQRLQESLRQAELMSRMGALVAGVAHEVRNPLFSISATVDSLEADFGSHPAYVECASLLRSQVARLSNLMRDLLDYGRPPVLQATPVRMADVVARAVRSCVLLARQHAVDVEERMPADLPVLHGDGARLEQVVQNLVANAIQHSPREMSVEVVGEADATAVILEVRDRGAGIPAADLPRLFEPFFSRRADGTGLGLPIVQRIVQAHGGRLEVAAREHGGTVMRVVLPVPGVVVGS